MDGSVKKCIFRKISGFLIERKNEKEIFEFFNRKDIKIFKIKKIVENYGNETSLFKVIISIPFNEETAIKIFHEEK